MHRIFKITRITLLRWATESSFKATLLGSNCQSISLWSKLSTSLYLKTKMWINLKWATSWAPWWTSRSLQTFLEVLFTKMRRVGAWPTHRCRGSILQQVSTKLIITRSTTAGLITRIQEELLSGLHLKALIPMNWPHHRLKWTMLTLPHPPLMDWFPRGKLMDRQRWRTWIIKMEGLKLSRTIWCSKIWLKATPWMSFRIRSVVMLWATTISTRAAIFSPKFILRLWESKQVNQGERRKQFKMTQSKTRHFPLKTTRTWLKDCSWSLRTIFSVKRSKKNKNKLSYSISRVQISPNL